MLKNYDEVADRLARVMREMDMTAAKYQTDIYLYIDGDGVGTVDTFVNVGGNSWLDDDHILVYQDKPHYESLPWDDMTDEDKDDYLPCMAEYRDLAMDYLDEALRKEG